MAEPIEMLFWLWCRMGPRRYVFDGGPDPLCEGTIALACLMTLSWAVQKRLNWLRCRLGCELGWAQGTIPLCKGAIFSERACPTTHCHEPYKNSWSSWDAVWVMDQVGPRKHVLAGGPDLGERTCLGMHNESVLCKKRLNRSRRRLVCGLGWPKGTVC